jgi:hypothetical protein
VLAILKAIEDALYGGCALLTKGIRSDDDFDAKDLLASPDRGVASRRRV